MDLLLLHAEVVAPVSHELIVLDKGSLIKEEFDALASRQLVLSVLLVDPGLTSTHHCFLFDGLPTLDERLVLCGHSAEAEVREWRTGQPLSR